MALNQAIGDSTTAMPIDENLEWIEGGEPKRGAIARIHLRDQSDIARLERRFSAEEMLPALNVFDAVRIAADVDLDKPAIIQVTASDGSAPAVSTSYRALKDQVIRAANLFHSASAGDPVLVATILPMIPDALIASWAAMASGVSIAINPYLEPDYVFALLNRVRATVLVTQAGDLGTGRWDDVEDLHRRVPSLKRILVVNGADRDRSYEIALRDAPDSLQFDTTQDPDACAAYQLTGGTTSAPKLCRLTHRGMLINAWLNGALQDCSLDGAVGHAMPNFHIAGAVVVGLRTIIFSQTLITLTPDGFRNRDVVRYFWDIARRHRLTAVLATPTTAAAILSNPDGDSSGHSITAFGCGGSTVPLAMNRAFYARFGVWLREQWGFSEAQGTLTGHFRDGREPVNGSVGYTLPFYRVRVFELDEANRFVRECRPGERGVLVVSGPVSPGYVESALDAGLFVSGGPDGQSWSSSGDLGAIDANGYVWLFGRSKDIIVRGGHNIDPALIEDVLIAHPSVQMAAAIGRPDPSKGEMPIAYVQLKEGMAFDLAGLRAHCAGNIQERAAVPVEIIPIDAMPVTPVGKISKPALRHDAVLRCARNVIIAVIGTDRSALIEMDDTGLRPCVRIQISTVDQLHLPAIQVALGRYEFIAEVTICA